MLVGEVLKKVGIFHDFAIQDPPPLMAKHTKKGLKQCFWIKKHLLFEVEKMLNGRRDHQP